MVGTANASVALGVKPYIACKGGWAPNRMVALADNTPLRECAGASLQNLCVAFSRSTQITREVCANGNIHPHIIVVARHGDGDTRYIPLFLCGGISMGTGTIEKGLFLFVRERVARGVSRGLAQSRCLPCMKKGRQIFQKNHRSLTRVACGGGFVWCHLRTTH